MSRLQSDTPSRHRDPNPARDLLYALQTILSLSALALIPGFLAVSRYVGQYGRLLRSNVPIQTYLSWGGKVVLSTLENITFPVLSVVIVIATLALPAMLLREYGRNHRQLSRSQAFGVFLRWLYSILGDRSTKIILYLALAITVFLSFYPGAVAPKLFSAELPYTVLVFRDGFDPAMLGLPVDPTQPKRTQPVQFVFEYADGVLVRAIDSASAVFVSNETIWAILDQGLPTPSIPQATPSTLTPSETPQF